MKKIKKTVSFLLLGALLGGLGLGLAACAPRDEVIKIATWEAYTDVDYVKDNFPAFYEAATGKKIKRNNVKISTFASNEELYEKLTKKKVDYDVICPSDYMAQRLMAEGMLAELDKSVVKGYDTLIEPAILEMTKVYDEEHKYTLPYAWGTFGILYNSKKVTESDMESWNALWNKKPDGTADAAYNNKIWIKNSERDVFALANIYNNIPGLSAASDTFTNYDNPEYQTLLKEMFEKYDAATLEKAKTALIKQKEVIYKYEEEEAKESLGDNKDEAYLSFCWSCDAGYAMQKNPDLRYSIPKEGGNVYVDCFVISKNAGNPAAAQQFMAFLLDKDTAYANTMMNGASGTVIAANAQIKEDLETMIADNTDFMKDTTEAFQKSYMYTVVFPNENQDDDILARCASMTDYGEEVNSDVAKMFASVKTEKGGGCKNGTAAIFAALTIVAAAVMVVKRKG